MMQSNRGAARVSIVWLIALLVVAGVFLTFTLLILSENTDLELQREAALASETQADTERNEVAKVRAGISEVVGAFDPESADPVSDVQILQDKLAELKQTFPDMGTVETIVDAVPVAISHFEKRGQEIRAREERIKNLESELAAARNTLSTVTRQKDDEIARLQQEISDQESNLQQRIDELDRRVASANTQASELDLEKRRSDAQAQESLRSAELEKQALQTRIDEMRQKLAFTRAPFKDNPDATVLSVSNQLPIGWIDIGANNRLARGMRFRVEAPTNTGSRRFKAMATVTDVLATQAEVRFEELVDTFDPVVRGDVLVNPLYDPQGNRVAVLLGRFSSASYNEKQLRSFLQQIGITVQEKVDKTTDYLIVGSELWSDPETGEPLDTPLQPSELGTYKEAESLGVEIVPLKSIREFFKFDETAILANPSAS